MEVESICGERSKSPKTAKLMRHETTTHTTHYGSWINESELEESVAKFIQGQKAAA